MIVCVCKYLWYLEKTKCSYFSNLLFSFSNSDMLLLSLNEILPSGILINLNRNQQIHAHTRLTPILCLQDSQLSVWSAIYRSSQVRIFSTIPFKALGIRSGNCSITFVNFSRVKMIQVISVKALREKRRLIFPTRDRLPRKSPFSKFRNFKNSVFSK